VSDLAARHTFLEKASALTFGTGLALFVAVFFLSWLEMEVAAKWILWGLCVPAIVAGSILQWKSARTFIAMRMQQGKSFKEARDEWSCKHPGD
jgi:hypothetical protein